MSRGRVERLMRPGHAGYGPPTVGTTTPNLIERNFVAAAPNRIWLADITYIETDQGWLYLATVRGPMNGAELPRKTAVAIGIMFVTAAGIYFVVRIFELAL